MVIEVVSDNIFLMASAFLSLCSCSSADSSGACNKYSIISLQISMAGIVHITAFLVWMLSSYLTNVMLMLYMILLFFKDPSWYWTVQNDTVQLRRIKSENMATNTMNKTRMRYLNTVQLLSNSHRNWVLLGVRTNFCI